LKVDENLGNRMLRLTCPDQVTTLTLIVFFCRFSFSLSIYYCEHQCGTFGYLRSFIQLG